MKSYMPKADEIKRNWYIIDADGMVLGRLASELAMILSGKRKPIYTPHLDTGDFVIVINAEKIKLTGNKLNKKSHYYHTGYPGGLKEVPYREMMQKHPDRLLRIAVKGMLPKNKLGKRMMKRLRIFEGAEHPHEAQQPIELEL